MDPCPFLRITIANLAVMLPPNRNLPSCVFLDCNIKLKGFPTQVSTINAFPKQDLVLENKIHASFNLNKTDIEKITARGKTCCLKIEICATKSMGIGFGYYTGGRILGSVFVEFDLKGFERKGSRGVVIKNGWVLVGVAKVHLNVKVQPDPRFIFQFDGEPECSPLVFQVNGNVKQPVFTCNFSFKNPGDWNSISRSSLSKGSTSIGCFNCWTTGNEIRRKERKGWLVTIHDLSGSPIAAASMVTPFVPSQGSNRVRGSNPGSWLILRPDQGTWKPWGRLQAWLENSGELGYCFEIIPDGANDTIKLVNSTISTKNGGKFNIDITNVSIPTMASANSSFDFSSVSGSWSDFGSSGYLGQILYRGFVMSSTVKGDGKCSKPEVIVGAQHVRCSEDAAVFVALAAAIDLSMDACRPFSQTLRKELRQSDQV
ncbi:uncharacterized protein LOC107002024 [Solanum pennellii]|uniref:Uncharacterized protein LOC107002024 n=1 Tax=Solanum pennellii TaxID=28526 RepID=A0ABM1FDQ6_SOLPN|nr:uncharacterized protein LOC107002024 [Solanum pennellii]